MEAEYAARAAGCREVGLDADGAHRRALAEAKDIGRQALEELHRRGLFPWPEEAPADPSRDGSAFEPDDA